MLYLIIQETKKGFVNVSNMHYCNHFFFRMTSVVLRKG
jgi:hypothetical protein